MNVRECSLQHGSTTQNAILDFTANENENTGE